MRYWPELPEAVEEAYIACEKAQRALYDAHEATNRATAKSMLAYEQIAITNARLAAVLAEHDVRVSPAGPARKE